MPTTNAVGSLVTSTLDWFKPPTTNNRFYPGGFTTMPTLQCAAYILPSRGGPTVAGNAQVTFAGGNLSSNLIKDVVIYSNGVVTVSNPGPDNLALAIVPSTGLFRGSFVNSAIDQTAAFAGYLIQSTNQFGAGLFFGTNQTGYVLIQSTP